MVMRDLASRLRVVRAEKNWGLVEAAKKIGISATTLGDAESGKRIPHAETVMKIAAGYGVPFGRLFTDAPVHFEDQGDQAQVRRIKHEFTVQSLLFAFEYLESLGYKPVGDETHFWIADAEGNRPEIDEFTEVLKPLIAMAPLAVGALSRRGTPGEAGTDAGGALLEAYSRWTEG
jgi:transcriptional regulator with XRE-family HTH domain